MDLVSHKEEVESLAEDLHPQSEERVVLRLQVVGIQVVRLVQEPCLRAGVVDRLVEELREWVVVAVGWVLAPRGEVVVAVEWVLAPRGEVVEVVEWVLAPRGEVVVAVEWVLAVQAQAVRLISDP